MLLGGLVDCMLALLISSICTTELAANAGCPLRLHVSASFSPTKPQHIYMMCHPQTVQVGKKIELFHILLAAKKFESPEYQSTVDGQATAPTMSDTIVITVPGDNSLIGKSCPIQWPATRKGLQTGTPTIEGIESVMFTYRFMEDRPGTYCTCDDQDPTTMFTHVQESEAGSAHSEHDAVNVPNGDEGQTRYGIPRTAEKVMAYTLGGRGHAALACPEAQLMAGNSVIYHNDQGPVERLLRWLAGICGGRDHAVYACPEAQLMADCPVIRLNEEGPIGWLLR